MNETICYRDSKEAFDEAIGAGFLTVNQQDSNYAGNYMYMHSNETQDFFKDIITRKYISRKHNKDTSSLEKFTY